MALVAPIRAATGYQHAAEFILFNMIESLVFLVLLMVFLSFKMYSAVWLCAVRCGAVRAVAVEDSLLLVLLALAFCVLAVPILALIFGARVVEFTKFWLSLLRILCWPIHVCD